jgi:hypothetical protein
MKVNILQLIFRLIIFGFFFPAAVARKDTELAKKKLTAFENQTNLKSLTSSQHELVTADVLATVRKSFLLIEKFSYVFSQTTNDEKTPDELGKSLTDLNESSEILLETNRILTTAEKLKRNEMEKTANWWTKYYASKARNKLEKRSKIDLDDGLEDSQEAYAQIFAEESSKSSCFFFQRQ